MNNDAVFSMAKREGQNDNFSLFNMYRLSTDLKALIAFVTFYFFVFCILFVMMCMLSLKPGQPKIDIESLRRQCEELNFNYEAGAEDEEPDQEWPEMLHKIIR